MAVNEGKIIFKDFTGEITEEIEDIILRWLETASAELESQVAMRTGDGKWHSQIKQEWAHTVDRKKYEAIIGNPMQEAIWLEYGTGEYALKGNGRKGYWVFVKDSTGKTSKSNKKYTLEEAKKTVAFMRSKGLEAMYTCGMKPQRNLHHAFVSNEDFLKSHLKRELKGLK